MQILKTNRFMNITRKKSLKRIERIYLIHTGDILDLKTQVSFRWIFFNHTLNSIDFLVTILKKFIVYHWHLSLYLSYNECNIKLEAANLNVPFNAKCERWYEYDIYNIFFRSRIDLTIWIAPRERLNLIFHKFLNLSNVF